MTVKIGHARHDERNKSRYGKAGDSGGEVEISNYYVHSKKWYVLRCKDDKRRLKIADACEYACKNQHIGYDQSQRLTLYHAVSSKGFDPRRVTKNVETDCSGLVRVCISYAFGKDIIGDFVTSNLVRKLTSTGQFIKLDSDKYCKSSKYLKRGDILCTRTKGHTVVVLDNGELVELRNNMIDTPKGFDIALIGKYKVIAETSLNVRTGAGVNKTRIDSLDAQTVVSCDGKFSLDLGKSKWMKVYFEDSKGYPQNGFVKASFLKPIKE